MNSIRKTPAPEARLPFVEASKARGKLYLYYRRDGRRQPLPGIEGSEEFLSEYHRIKSEFESATVRWGVHTVGAAIMEYLGSADYGDLADNSRREYRRVLDLFRRDFGSLELSALDGAWVSRLRDKYARTDSPHQWLSLRARMIAVEGHYRRMHPRLGLETLWAESKRLRTPDSDQNRPWPANVVLDVMREATSEFRALLTVCLLTSQRISDVCALTPDAYDRAGRTLRFQQEKTKTHIALHVPDYLATTLDKMSDRLSNRLLVTPRGRPWTDFNARETLQAICHRLGLDRYVLHGLRATGPVALKMLGFENRAIRTLTGHTSDGQLEVYLRGVANLPLAVTVQEALAEKYSGLFEAADADGANARRFSGVTGRAAASAGAVGSSRKKMQAENRFAKTAKHLPNAKPDHC